jgi:hypothetical protein
MKRLARKDGRNSMLTFLREQGVGSSNLPAPTNVLSGLALSPYGSAHDNAHERQGFAGAAMLPARSCVLFLGGRG